MNIMTSTDNLEGKEWIATTAVYEIPTTERFSWLFFNESENNMLSLWLNIWEDRG